MPPPSSPFGDDTIADDQPDLSDEDVEVLHHIIVKAQSLPHAEHRPYDVLFKAYDVVREERGRDPERDPVYFGVLLRIGALPGAGTLYEKFEELLWSMGISIEFDPEELGSHNQSSEVEGLEDDSRTSIIPPESATKTTRRASFSSFQDTIHDRTIRQLDRRPRRVSFDTVPDATHDVPRIQARSPGPKRQAARRPSHATPAGLDAQLEGENRAPPAQKVQKLSGPSDPRRRPRLTSREAPQFPSNVRASSASTLVPEQGPLHHPLGHRPRKEEGVRNTRTVSDSAQPRRSGNGAPIHLPTDENRPPLQAGYSSAVARTVSDADNHNRQRLLYTFFRKLHDSAIRHRPLHERMELRAIEFDRRVLLHQALEDWRLRLRYKRQLAETERFFAHLERRASKARDLYLLTKAFTHWAQVAHEGVQRTSVARRHLLRLKYFSAWQHITTVNELKVRRFGLRRSFTLWKNQVYDLLQRELEAVATYRVNLTRRVYWVWFWSFCERRAPEWYEAITKRKHLNCWIEGFQANKDRNHQAEAKWDFDTLGKIWHSWVRHQQLNAEQHEKARQWRRRKALQAAITRWRAQTRLRPVSKQISDTVDLRLLRDTLNLWRARTESERYAARVNNYRLLRNAWTAWNDRLICQSLASQIDDRVVLQALYKWVLAGRYAVCRRIFNDRLKRRVLSLITTKWGGLRDELYGAEQRVRSIENRRLMRSMLGQWKMRLQLHQQREQIAYDFDRPRATQGVLQQWAQRRKQVEQLDDDAASANYFFLATKTIRTWRSAVTQSRRQKRQAAYAHVRRKNKMALARGLLRIWRDQTAQIAENNRVAADVRQDQVQLFRLRYFDIWRTRSSQIFERDQEARSVQRSMALQGVMLAWRERSQQIPDFNRQATYNSELLLWKQTSVLMRKLSLLVFQYRRHERDVEEFRIRIDKQHFRRMFHYWREKALQRIGVSPLDSLEQAPLSGVTTLAEANGAGTATESPLAQDLHPALADRLARSGVSRVAQLSGMASSTRATPLPAYLSTPSRIARAAARVGSSNTTTMPHTPQGTPLGSRLRQQLFAGRRSTRRTDLYSSTFAPEEP